MCRADPGANWLNGFDDYIGTTLMPRVVGFDPDTHERVGAGNPRELGRTFGDNLGGYSHLGVQAQKA